MASIRRVLGARATLDRRSDRGQAESRGTLGEALTETAGFLAKPYRVELLESVASTLAGRTTDIR
jgi:hypothetical protein